MIPSKFKEIYLFVITQISACFPRVDRCGLLFNMPISFHLLDKLHALINIKINQYAEETNKMSFYNTALIMAAYQCTTKHLFTRATATSKCDLAYW